MYEDKCREYVCSRGITVLFTNFRNRYGEIDIVGTDNIYLIFFEVKYRKNSYTGFAESAVNYSKQRNICRVSDYYRLKYGYGDDTPVRYDVLAVNDNEITWYKNAFEYIK